MTTQIRNAIKFTIMAMLLLAVACVGVMLIVHPSADGSSTYIGGMMITIAVAIQVLLMMRGPKQ